MFFTVAVYAFEGIGTVLPVYTAMRTRGDFIRPLGVLNISAVLMICIELAIAFLGYVKFGQDCKASITLNMPKEAIYESVRLVFAWCSLGVRHFNHVHLSALHVRAHHVLVAKCGEQVARQVASQ